jgi:hypothetical protein
VYSSLQPISSPITTIRMGSRMDTLNRRKNATPEAPYSSVIYP